MSIIKDRHIGRFTVSIELINSAPNGLRALFASVIVLKSEMNVYNDDDVIEYWAICDAFTELPEGAPIPLYYPSFKANYDDTGKVTSVELVDWHGGL